MTRQVGCFLVVICAAALSGVPSFAQSTERRPTSAAPQALEQTLNPPPNLGATETVANEIGLLRKSLQTLNARLREISEKALASYSKPSDPSKDQQNRIALGLELLSRAEQRAEALRKQLLELTEKETSFKSRLVQIVEDMRPDSIERATSLIGSTRTPELRDARRRILENERRGVESLLNQTSQSRIRLEDDVREADSLVMKLRQRVLPLIEKEIEKINPDAVSSTQPSN